MKLAPSNDADRARLDLADRARSALRSALVGCGATRDESEDGASLNRMLDLVPQFVVVGAQSAGKSSVLSRLSGVTFPQSSELCTRIGALLKLRRGPVEPVRVVLVGELDDKRLRKEFHSEGRDTEEAIRLAQEHAIACADAGDGFVETLEIEVEVQAPETFNVTLVDLPGLLAPTPDSIGPETVERIVKKYANMSGSLLLFIVPSE
jgi:hypothetical protein